MPANKSVAKKIIRFLLIGVTFIFLFNSTSLAQGGDTAVKHHHIMSRPAKAMMYSALLPGLGQAYNKSYWKIPIIYAGLATAIYFVSFNEHYYKIYRDSLNGNHTTVYTSSQLSDLITYYNHNRDLTYIIAAGIYLLNIVDANVGAQMHGFNVSDDISLHFSPNFAPNPLNGTMSFQPGFSIVKRL